ncbi:MAG: hypothetical protein LUI39_00950 [Lachnospiraceae bacterium]|nr:hypothetical protein [Lachnospiraceae bacterium]
MNGYRSVQQFRTNQSYRKILSSLLFLSSGVLLGCAFPKLFSMDSGTWASLTSRYSFGVYERISRDCGDIFLNVASVRLPVLLFLWMSSFTSAGWLFHLGYAWWLAASGSMLFALFGLRNGIHGILLFGCCVLPQWMLYGMMWKRETASWLKRELAFGESATPGAKNIRRQDIAELLRLAALCLLGCACEAFLGTWTLDLYLRL